MKTALVLFSPIALASGKVYFSETFGEGWENRWTLSTSKETEKEKMGKWSIATGKVFKDKIEDRGLMTTEVMKFYGVAAPFEAFSNEGKELVIQYQAKYEKSLGCGGGYLKIGPKQDDLTKFGEPTPYNIMFGPDQCNADKRTHLIFNAKGKNYLKKEELPYKQEGEGTAHLYRLVLKPDNTVRVEIDQEKIYEGSLGEDWDMLPAKEIPDPDAKKPSDWVDDAMMDDPAATTKPADWVEGKLMLDKTATKPEDWDDEEDGVWEVPQVDNPEYKGEWIAQKVSNPAYKGAWQAERVINPEFVNDPALYKYSDFGYIGFDVYQVKGGTIFDNIIITDSTSEADEFAKKWKALAEYEQAEKKKSEEGNAAVFEKFRAARAAKAAAAEEKKAAADKDAKPEDVESKKEEKGKEDKKTEL